MKKQHTTERLERVLKNVKSTREAEDYIAEYTGSGYDSFAQYFNDYIGEKGLPVTDIIDRSNVSRNYAYNIINGDRKPGRDKIIAMCIGAGMNCDEINRALKIAKEGVLYVKDERDARIVIAVNRGVKTVTELNIILQEENLDIIE